MIDVVCRIKQIRVEKPLLETFYYDKLKKSTCLKTNIILSTSSSSSTHHIPSSSSFSSSSSSSSYYYYYYYPHAFCSFKVIGIL